MSNEVNQENKNTEKKKSFFRSGKFKIILSVVIICFAFIAVSKIVLARHFHKFGDGPFGFMIERLVENLNLDANQKSQVERIRGQIKERMELKKQTREDLFDEFANEFKKDILDKNKLRELSEKKDKDTQEMKEFVLDKIIEFHNILTPEQRNKTVESVKEMKSKFHDKMKMHKKDSE